MDVSAIRQELMQALANHLAPVPLIDLEVAPDLDHDGDPILRMRAVYDDRVGTPSDDQVFEAHSVITGRLASLAGDRFPILTFISLNDQRADAA